MLDRRLALFVASLAAACSSSPPASAPPPAADGDAATDADAPPAATPDGDAATTAFRFLEGRFDSQSQANRSRAYYAIQLQTCEVDAPELGEHVLYLEQARMDFLDQPYRQRLYVIEDRDPAGAHAVSRVFELASPDAWIHACDQKTKRHVAAHEATEKAGCAVDLKWSGDRFEGGTTRDDCPSAENGATHATSVVVLRADGLSSWDRGYDANGKQVWGAIAGPYVFERKTPLP